MKCPTCGRKPSERHGHDLRMAQRGATRAHSCPDVIHDLADAAPEMRDALKAQASLIRNIQKLCQMYLEPGEMRIQTEHSLTQAILSALDGPLQREAQGKARAALALAEKREVAP